MMNWRKVVCVLCAGMLCTGLALAGGPGKATVVKLTSASSTPTVQPATGALFTPGTVQHQSSSVSVKSELGQPQLAGNVQPVPAGMHVRPVGANRTCVDYIWDNVPYERYYFGANSTASIETFIGYPAGGNTIVSCLYAEVIVNDGSPSTLPEFVTFELAPHEGMPAYPGTTQTIQFDATGGYGVYIDFAGPVDISADLATYGYVTMRQTWVDSTGLTAYGGPLIGDYAELGSEYNWNAFYWNGGYWWFGNGIWANFAVSLFGPNDVPTMGACCTNFIADGYASVCFETDDYFTCQYSLGLLAGELVNWKYGEACPGATDCFTAGACCQAGVCVATTYQRECTLWYGGCWFPPTGCDVFTCPPPPPNDNCADVTPIALVEGVPVTIPGDDTCATQDCGALGWGADTWTVFTLDATHDVRIDFCGSATYQYTIGIVLDTVCPCSGTFIYASAYSWDCGDGNPHLTFFGLPAGTYYYPKYPVFGPYQITLQALAPCVVDCPPGSTPELEICGDLYPNGTNGGCNSTPPAFEAIACGETVCGTVWADSSYRDTDWYELVTTEWFNFTWTAVGDAPFLIFVMDGTGGCGAYTVLGSATADPCLAATITTPCMHPGTYWFWAGTSVWGAFPCPRNYYGTLTCEPCTPPPAPPNDNCEDVVPQLLNPGIPLTFTGDSTGATPECFMLGWPGEVWEAFTTTETMNVTVDFCGTTPPFATIGIVLSDCPCTVLTFDTTYDFSTCGDGNGTIFFNGLPAGTWYYPVYVSPTVFGPYTMHVNGTPPPPDCAAGANICDEYISSVTFADIANVTGCGLGDNGTPGYSNYRAIVGHVDAGSTYTITVLNGPATYAGDDVDVWCDFNGNLFWTDPGEDTLLTTADYATFTGSITIPMTSVSDFVMRIRMDYYGAHNPCGITTYGEVEDYTIHVNTPFPKGDMNCDGLVNAFDIDPFVKCLISGTPTPPCTDCKNGDINGDNAVNAFDIDPFVQCIIHGGCP